MYQARFLQEYGLGPLSAASSEAVRETSNLDQDQLSSSDSDLFHGPGSKGGNKADKSRRFSQRRSPASASSSGPAKKSSKTIRPAAKTSASNSRGESFPENPSPYGGMAPPGFSIGQRGLAGSTTERMTTRCTPLPPRSVSSNEVNRLVLRAYNAGILWGEERERAKRRMAEAQALVEDNHLGPLGPAGDDQEEDGDDLET